MGIVIGIPGGVWGEDCLHRLGATFPYPGHGPVSTNGYCVLSNVLSCTFFFLVSTLLLM